MNVNPSTAPASCHAMIRSASCSGSRRSVFLRHLQLVGWVISRSDALGRARAAA